MRRPEIPESHQGKGSVRKVKTVDGKAVFDGPAEEKIYDLRLSYPHGPKPILDEFDGLFSNVFVALHPFIKIDGIVPENVGRGMCLLDRPDFRGNVSQEVLDQLSEQNSSGPLFDYETFLKFEKHGTQISWSELGASCGLTQLQDVGRALHGFNSKTLTPAPSEMLNSYLKREKIFLPIAGQFPGPLEDKFVELFRRLQIENIFLADEFEDCFEAVSIDALNTTTPWRQVFTEVKPCVRRIFSDDLSLVLNVDWESHFTLLCSTSERLHEINIESLFDGFFCDASTRHLWYLDDSEIVPFDKKGLAITEIIEKNTAEYENSQTTSRDDLAGES